MQSCDRWWELDLWFVILWSLVELLCKWFLVGGGTSRLYEVQQTNLPRWSFCREGILVKLGLPPAAEGSSPLVGGADIHPTEQSKLE